MRRKSLDTVKARHPVRAIRILPCLIAVLAIGSACSNLEEYRRPEQDVRIATIEDDPHSPGSLEYVKLMSIDRRRVDRDSRGVSLDRLGADAASLGDPDDWVPLDVGLRKLEARVCKYRPGLLDVLAYAGWYCGHAVISLEAEPGAHYVLRGDLNKRQGYAELWVEDGRSGEIVTEVTLTDIE